MIVRAVRYVDALRLFAVGGRRETLRVCRWCGALWYQRHGPQPHPERHFQRVSFWPRYQNGQVQS